MFKSLILNVHSRYIEKIKLSGVGVDGQCSKLEHFSLAIQYIIFNDKVTDYKELLKVREKLSIWKKNLRKERKKENGKNFRECFRF